MGGLCLDGLPMMVYCQHLLAWLIHAPI
uniref:Uncharacterized protein n=1 Tax=Arundo donax TaxID=35708 RepID=A0A0A9CGX2_ARUDO